MTVMIVAPLFLLVVLVSAAPSSRGIESVVEGPSGIVTDVGPIGPVENCLVYGNMATAVHPGSADIYPNTAAVEPVISFEHKAAALNAGGGSIAASNQGVTITGPPTVPVVIVGPSGKIYAEGLWGPTSNIGGNGVYGDAGHIGLGRGYAW